MFLAACVVVDRHAVAETLIAPRADINLGEVGRYVVSLLLSQANCFMSGMNKQERSRAAPRAQSEM